MEPAEKNYEVDNKKSTATNVFAWIAAIVVNGAFVALIVWSVTSSWIMGFVTSSVYTYLIFYGSFRLKRSQERENNGNSVLTSVLFFLAVIAIGITTFIPVMNLIGNCAKPSVYIPHSNPSVINTAGLPEKVVSWLMFSYFPTATFVYIPQTETTIFMGSDETSSSLNFLWPTGTTGVWATNSTGGYPKPISSSKSLINPTSLVSVSNGSSACFTAQLSNDYSSSVIACTDGKSLNTSKTIPGLQSVLVSDGDSIWFKVNDESVYSVIPIEGLSQFELHDGIYQTENKSDVDVEHEQCNLHSLFLGLLFLSFIPVLVSAVVLQARYKIPSMPIAEYIAATLILVSMVFIVKPTSSSSEIFDALNWWLPFSSLLCLLGNTFCYLTNRIDSSTLSWSSNFSGLIFFVGMLLLPFGPGISDWWRMTVLTITTYLPLIVLSIILEATLLMVLGALGILFDVWNLVSLFTETLPDSVRNPLSFAILAVSGFALALFGILLNKKQDQLTFVVQTWAKNNLSNWIKRQPQPVPQGELDEENETVSSVADVETAVLLS